MSTATAFMPLFENFVFETVSCYSCGSASSKEFIVAQDDLTGKPGSFRFVTCQDCGLVYQNPRITIDHIKPYYDDEYIAHRKKTDWGRLTWFYNRVMDRHDIVKDHIVRRTLWIDAIRDSLDVCTAVGTILLQK